MVDIVQRLRKSASEWRGAAPLDSETSPWPRAAALEREAADEIERLRKERDELRAVERDGDTYRWKNDGGYRVTVRPGSDEEQRDHGRGCTAFAVSWLGRTDHPCAVLFTPAGGGTMFLEFRKSQVLERISAEDWHLRHKGFMYVDEARGVLLALTVAFQEMNRQRQEALEEFRSDDRQREMTAGHDVTLNYRETVEFLRRCRSRGSGFDRLEVLYDDKWLSLCRTDLVDDVCTTRSNMTTVDDYIDAVKYGARIDDRLFAVIDATTDG